MSLEDNVVMFLFTKDVFTAQEYYIFKDIPELQIRTWIKY